MSERCYDILEKQQKQREVYMRVKGEMELEKYDKEKFIERVLIELKKEALL